MSKSSKIPTAQNVTKDSVAFPVPKQLITNEREAISKKTDPKYEYRTCFPPKHDL